MATTGTFNYRARWLKRSGVLPPDPLSCFSWWKPHAVPCGPTKTLFPDLSSGYCLGLTDIPLTVSPHFGFCDTSFSHLFVLIFKLLHWIVFFLPLRGRCPWGPILGPFLLIWTLLGSFICALVHLSHISTTNYQDHVRGEALCLDLLVLILSQASGHVPNCL